MPFHCYSDAHFLYNRCRLLTFTTLRLRTITGDFPHEILYFPKSTVMRAYKKSTCKQSLQIAYMLFYSITKRQLMSFLLFPVYNKILYLCIINHVFIKSISAVSDIAVDKRKVCQPVFVRCSYVKKVVTRSVNIAY